MERNHRSGPAFNGGAARGEQGLGPGKQTLTEQLIARRHADVAGPGKHTLTEQLAARMPARDPHQAAPASHDDIATAAVETRSSGAPLDGDVRGRIEPHLGTDLGGVRVHTDANASAATQAIGARAFTHGSDIYVSDRESPSDLGLMAHETTHVVQQGAAAPAVQRKVQVGSEDHPAEREADAVAQRVVSGAAPAPIASATSGPAVQRNPDKDKPKDKPKDFKPAAGTKVIELKGKFGVWKVEHGLSAVPDATKPGGAGKGKYTLKILFTPNDKTGTSKIGFVQVYRQGMPDGGWAKKEGDYSLTKDEAARTDEVDGWAIDRADPKGDKTPFYGMFKSGSTLNQYTRTQVGTHGGDDAMLSDTPDVWNPDQQQFVSTAMDMASGTEFGAVFWGYHYDGAKKVWADEEPRLVDSTSDEMKGRDRAIKKWNDVVATPGSGIDKVPGK